MIISLHLRKIFTENTLIYRSYHDKTVYYIVHIIPFIKLFKIMQIVTPLGLSISLR